MKNILNCILVLALAGMIALNVNVLGDFNLSSVLLTSEVEIVEASHQRWDAIASGETTTGGTATLWSCGGGPELDCSNVSEGRSIWMIDR